jgi:hypothetical protein
MRVALIVLVLAACAAPPPTPDVAPTGGKSSPPTAARGLSCDSAVVVSGSDGERAWVQDNYPGAKVTGQTTANCNGRTADAVTILTANGESRTLYFFKQ